MQYVDHTPTTYYLFFINKVPLPEVDLDKYKILGRRKLHLVVLMKIYDVKLLSFQRSVLYPQLTGKSYKN
jgi:hypothetical protein